MRLCAIALLVLCVPAAACSSLLGDFSLSEATPDASTGGGGPGPADAEAGARDAGGEPAPTVHAVVSGVSVYLGQTATLDASRSTTTRGTPTFSWSVSSQPQGSAVTTASLVGASSATPSFVPDVAGSYTLRVVVTALGASDTAAATVIAASAQVLFAHGVAGAARPDGGPDSVDYTIADLSGANAHPVICPDVLTGASPAGPQIAAYAGRAYDYWEAPPGQLSRFAAFTLESTDAGMFAHLWAGTGTSSCASPPVDFGTERFGPGRPYGSEPSFKPDGSRFAVFDRQWRVVTYPADGNGASHVVADYPISYAQAPLALDPVGVGSGSGYVFEPPRVVWTASGLAWAQPTQRGWEIVTAPDVDGATLSTYMTCTGVTPRQIAMLGDGTVVASYRAQGPGSSEDLYLLKPGADAQRSCMHEQQYTHLGDAGSSVATDFAISPDGTQIAFLQIDTTTQDASAWTQVGSQLPGGYVYVVPVAGGACTQLSSAPALYGPRWIAGGTALVFTRLDGVAPSTGLPATSVVVVAADGGAPQVVAQGDGVGTFVSTSGNAACSAAAPAAAGAGAASWLLPVVVYAVRRRRASRR